MVNVVLFSQETKSVKAHNLVTVALYMDIVHLMWSFVGSENCYSGLCDASWNKAWQIEGLSELRGRKHKENCIMLNVK
jgi:hypothetical protein